MENKIIYNVYFLGSPSVGKTSIIKRLLDIPIDPMEGVTIYKVITEKTFTFKGESFTTSLIDTAGQERYQDYVYKTLHSIKPDIIFLVYSMNEISSFEDIDKFYERLQTDVGVDGTNLILIGNKKDLINDIQVQHSEAKTYASKRKMRFFEVSAKTGENISDLCQLIPEILSKIKKKPLPTEEQLNRNTVNLDSSAKPAYCCF